MATQKHRQRLLDMNTTNDLNVEQCLRKAMSDLPIEQRTNHDSAKIYQQLIESFYIYESNILNFVSERDMPNVIYSLGLVPSQNEMHDLIFAMRFHSRSRNSEREELDAEHNLIHIDDYADIIIPKLLNNKYKAADEHYLLRCLKALDLNNKNYLHKKSFIQRMSTAEDAFNEQEADNLLNFLMQNENLSIENLPDFFDYKRYVKHLLPQRHLIYLDLGVTK